MGARGLAPTVRTVWMPAAELPDEMKRCCAKCRRGTPALGLRPCGYLLNCPNDCHRKGK